MLAVATRTFTRADGIIGSAARWFFALRVIFGSFVAPTQFTTIRSHEPVSRHCGVKSVAPLGSLRPASGPGMRWQGDCVMLGQDSLARRMAAAGG